MRTEFFSTHFLLKVGLFYLQVVTAYCYKDTANKII